MVPNTVALIARRAARRCAAGLAACLLLGALEAADAPSVVPPRPPALEPHQPPAPKPAPKPAALPAPAPASYPATKTAPAGLTAAAPLDPAAAKLARELFETSYAAGSEAVKARNWVDAELHLTTALKALGNEDHPRREVAELLQKKARDVNRSSRQLDTAEELLRLGQHYDALLIYQRAARVVGLNDRIATGLAAAEKGYKADMNERGAAATKADLDTVKTRVGVSIARARDLVGEGQNDAALVLLDEVERTMRAYRFEVPEAAELYNDVRRKQKEQARQKELAEKEQRRALKEKEEAAANPKQEQFLQPAPVKDKKTKFFAPQPVEKVKEQF